MNHLPFTSRDQLRNTGRLPQKYTRHITHTEYRSYSAIFRSHGGGRSNPARGRWLQVDRAGGAAGPQKKEGWDNITVDMLVGSGRIDLISQVRSGGNADGSSSPLFRALEQKAATRCRSGSTRKALVLDTGAATRRRRRDTTKCGQTNLWSCRCAPPEQAYDEKNDESKYIPRHLHPAPSPSRRHISRKLLLSSVISNQVGGAPQIVDWGVRSKEVAFLVDGFTCCS